MVYNVGLIVHAPVCPWHGTHRDSIDEVAGKTRVDSAPKRTIKTYATQVVPGPIGGDMSAIPA